MKKFKKYLAFILYWTIQLTWGCLLTIPGIIITLFAILIGGTPHKNGFSYIVEIGGNWGGLELGAVALCGRYYENDLYWFEHTRKHEFGHSIQQLMFGPFQLFIVGIPSAIRYWYQTIRNYKHLPNKPYDSIWFEGTATKWGTKWVDLIENNNVDN